jgi:hypothetical protein
VCERIRITRQHISQGLSVISSLYAKIAICVHNNLKMFVLLLQLIVSGKVNAYALGSDLTVDS